MSPGLNCACVNSSSHFNHSSYCVLFYLIALYGCVCQPLINGYDDDDEDGYNDNSVDWQWPAPVTAEQVHTGNTGSAGSACWYYVLLDGTSCIMGVAGRPCIAPIGTPASQAYIERVFSVSGMLSQGRRNRMSTSLEMRVRLKLNANVLAWSPTLNLWLSASHLMLTISVASCTMHASVSTVLVLVGSWLCSTVVDKKL